MAILKSIGMWLLQMFLGGVFKDVQNREVKKAEEVAGRATIAARTADESARLEREIRDEYDRIDKVFKERQRDPDDVFGWDVWNKGT